MFHPATQILVWGLLVTTVQRLPFLLLLWLTLLTLLISLHFSPVKLRQLLRRTRWLLLTLLLVYAYNVPGVALLPVLDNFSPTHEGVQEGLTQLSRLLLALASLAFLLDKLDRTQWMSGIHSLLTPLHWLGLSRERFSIRLVLTLQYAEAGMLRGGRRWQDILHDLADTPDNTPLQALQLPRHAFTWLDGLLLLAGLLFWWISA